MTPRNLSAEVAEEFAAVAGMGGEWFSPDAGWTFFARAGRPEANPERSRLQAKLRWMRWSLANPERRREIIRRSKARPEYRARELARQKAQRDAKPREMRTCVRCGATFIRARKGVPPRFCGSACRGRHSAKAAAERAKADPVKFAALRTRQREWARQKRKAMTA